MNESRRVDFGGVLCVIGALGSSACSPSALPSTPTPSVPSSNANATAPRAEPVAAADPPAPAELPPSTPAAQAFADFAFEHVLAQPARSLAVGNPPKVAALADEPYLFDGTAFERRALPEAHRIGGDDAVQIFFGRDNQPRLMGTRVGPDGARQTVYLRHLPAGWKRAPDELGPLASATGGLYGILGYADPELVCAPGSFCLIKRVTGWSRVPADPEPRPVFLTASGLYKAVDTTLLRLVQDAWAEAHTLPAAPTSLCQRTEDELWVVGADETVFQVRVNVAGAATVVEPGLPGPRALHCAPGGALWLVGVGGAAHYDGTTWRPVAGDFGALAQVTGRGDDEVWLAGERGVFRGRRR